jgi:hypothetical protein
VLDFLASFDKRRKVSIGGRQYVEFVGNGESMFLPLRSSRARKMPCGCCHEAREFYCAFDGLRERPP